MSWAGLPGDIRITGVATWAIQGSRICATATISRTCASAWRFGWSRRTVRRRSTVSQRRWMSPGASAVYWAQAVSAVRPAVRLLLGRRYGARRAHGDAHRNPHRKRKRARTGDSELVHVFWSQGEGVDGVKPNREYMITDQRNWVSGAARRRALGARGERRARRIRQAPSRKE